jgi:predicted N-formylglutamate amidohydrolase
MQQQDSPRSRPSTVLAPGEPPAVVVERRTGASPFVFACDHASWRIPQSLGTLGLEPSAALTHVAWDIGALQVALLLSAALDAPLVRQNYSRLVIDCNRLPAAADSIALVSDSIRITGNERLDAAARESRAAEIFSPYHHALNALLEERQQAAMRSILVAIHSFTPTYAGVPRPWHIGLMHRRDARLAAALLRLLREDVELHVGDNEPYTIQDVDYTLPVHGEVRGLAHVGIEIRQDLVGASEGQQRWAAILARTLPLAATNLV